MKLLAIPRLRLKQPKFLARLVSQSNAQRDPGKQAERDGNLIRMDTISCQDRIGHCHCKDAVKKPDGQSYEWAAMAAASLIGSGSLRR